MSDLVGFLLARVAEDEAAARACMSREPGFREGPRAGRWSLVDPDEGTPRAGRFGHVATVGITVVAWPDHAAHIARHDPARVLAECEAKRRIVEAVCSTRQERRPTDVPGRYDVVTVYVPMDEAGGDLVLPLLAVPYADHPDYRPEWAL